MQTQTVSSEEASSTSNSAEQSTDAALTQSYNEGDVATEQLIFKTKKSTGLALFAKLLAFFPGFTNPQRDDVIIANRVLNDGVIDIQQSDLVTVKEAMEVAKSFYSKYARLLGLGLGAAVSVLVEWVQSIYPDYQGIRAAHAGSGVIASWVVSNIMSEYERRIHQLKERMKLT
ncbi:hypothetical protein EYS14_19495 [Alteromonadaceae bacterium M269]|nr:hypothetical protein EYS14_19495 [Alteromonadaceae bacterium M269]